MVTITVLSKQIMDTLLKNKWSAMKNAMANSDVTGSANYFNDTSREKYTEILQFLLPRLPEVAAGLRPIEADYIRQDTAEYRISRSETINGQSRDLTYFIYFVRDKNGIWKIESL